MDFMVIQMMKMHSANHARVLKRIVILPKVVHSRMVELVAVVVPVMSVIFVNIVHRAIMDSPTKKAVVASIASVIRMVQFQLNVMDYPVNACVMMALLASSAINVLNPHQY